MPLSQWSAMGVLSAGAIVLTPSPAHPSIADVFAPGPRVDLAIELDYRSRFLAPDAVVTTQAAADRVGRERLDDSRSRVARAYLDRLGEELADEMIDQVPLLRLIEERYRRYADVRLAGDDPDDPTRPVPAAAPGAAPADERFSLRLRLNAISEGLDLAPGLHLVRGLLEWRVAYRPLSERVEMTARRPLTDRLALELTSGQSVTGGGPAVQLGLTLSF